MPAGKLVFSGMEFVKSSRCGSSVRISVWRGTSTGGSTGEKRKKSHNHNNNLLKHRKINTYHYTN